MAFLVVAYPEISKADFEEIQNFRSQHDALYYHLVQPHFTIVFPIDNIPENVFRAEVISKAKAFSKFSFVLRSAVVNQDAFSNQFHIFLVPDEGFSALIKLHDLMYSDTFKENHRLDIDFIPHIGIGNSTDRETVKAWVDEWNSKDFSIIGQISFLTILQYENGKVESILDVRLNENQE